MKTGFNDLDNIINKFDARKISNSNSFNSKEELANTINEGKNSLPIEHMSKYIDWFKNTPIVKEAVSLWGTKEKLMNAIKEQATTQKGIAWNWWNKFINYVLNAFKPTVSLSERELSKLNDRNNDIINGVNSLLTNKLNIKKKPFHKANALDKDNRENLFYRNQQDLIREIKNKIVTDVFGTVISYIDIERLSYDQIISLYEIGRASCRQRV